MLVPALPCAAAAIPTAPPQVPPFFHHQVWSTEDGLPQESVHALLQSRDGYLWVATEGGAARFDGQGFVVLNHAADPAFLSDDISCLAQDGAGDLWFGTLDGLVQKHGDRLRHFSRRDGLPSDEIVALAASGPDLLAFTTEGLAAWRQDRFVPVVTNAAIIGLSTTVSGTILVQSSVGLLRWDHGKLVTVPAAADAHTLSPAIESLRTESTRAGADIDGARMQVTYVDRHGNTWMGTNQGLFYSGPGVGSHAQDVPALRGESILSLLEDREGDLWIGTEASGLQALQPRTFTTAPGSENGSATTVVAERSGTMVFGTRDSGVVRAASASPMAVDKLTSPVILSLAAGASGDLWAGTPDGLNHIVGNNVRRWTVADGLPDNFVRSVAVAADGAAWAGTRFGLVRIDGNALHTFTTADGLLSNSVGPMLKTTLSPGRASTLWVGTSAGLCRLAAGQFHCLPSPFPPVDSIVTALGQDHDGAVWLGLHGHGLALAGDDRIVSLFSASLPREIVGILADSSGGLWLRGTHGLYRAAVAELHACLNYARSCSTLKVREYGRSDGMPSDEIAGAGNVPVALGPAGELWFATRRGVAVTDPQHLSTNGVPPRVAITQVHVDGVALSTGAPAELGPAHRQYSFDYAGVSLNNTARVHFRYMLQGFEHSWVDAGTRHTAFYTNLPPGRYTFRVMAANSDELWSPAVAGFAFQVMKPWYRSLWALALAFCLAALGVLAFVQLRVRAERHRFALLLGERTRVAREVHDTLAQDLVSVSLQVELAAQHAKTGRSQEAAEHLAQARSLVRQALESARQSIWNLRANLATDSLPALLAARVQALRDSTLSARLRIGGEYRRESQATELELMRIASEAIANAERHAGATEITVDLHYSADSLRLGIRDNGRGFDVAAAHALNGHYGLRGLRERTALLGGHLTIESMEGQGTTVSFAMPLPAEGSKEV